MDTCRTIDLISPSDGELPGYAPDGWRSELRPSRAPESTEDLIAIARGARDRLKRELRLGRPDADDLSPNAGDLVSEVWLLTRLFADPRSWSDLPAEPSPDTSYTHEGTGTPLSRVFRFETARNALWELQQYLMTKRAESANGPATATSCARAQAMSTEGSATFTLDLHEIERLYRLNDLEEDILRAVGDAELTGEEIAARAKRDWTSHFKSTLSSLTKRTVLTNSLPRYRKSRRPLR